MVQSTVRRWTASIAMMVVLLVWATPSGAWSTAATAFSGEAVAFRATVLPLGLTTSVADTGPLPASGGALEASLINVSSPGLSADVLHASTVGQGSQARSEASVADLSLTREGISLSASFLSSQATAACQDQGPSVSGSSQIVDLVINGQSIAVAGSPNETIPLPNGEGAVVINEQSGGTSGSTGTMTVNALHVTVTGVADIVIASAHADISCGQAICTGPNEFVTGGGWITGPSGAKANFAVAGGTQPGWGHLVYIDHGQPAIRVKATAITAYTNLGGTVRRIEGAADVNGASGTFQADVADNGEPGRMDTFTLRLSNGYTASGMLDGGNIQLHNPCP